MMRKYATVLLLGILSAACAPGTHTASDLGVAPGGMVDLAVTDGLPPPADQAETDGSAPIVTLQQLTYLAGWLGGTGSLDDSGGGARFHSPGQTATDGLGNLFVADSGNNTIRQVVLATGVVTTLAGSSVQSGSADGVGGAARFQQPGSLVADGAGNLYVADTGNNTIRQVVVATGAVSTLAGSPGSSGSADGIGAAALLARPYSMTLDGDGNLYFAETVNHTIRKLVLATGAVSTLAGTLGQSGSTDGVGAAARFYYPGGLTADRAGTLYIADTRNHTIRKLVLATGVVSTLSGSTAVKDNIDGSLATARFELPNDLVMNGPSSFYVGDLAAGTVRQVVVSSGQVTTVASNVGGCGGFSGDSTGHLYCAESASILQLTLAPLRITHLAGSESGAGNGSNTFNLSVYSGVAVDSAGNVYFSDTYNCSIRKLVLARGTLSTSTLAGGSSLCLGSDGIGTAAGFSYPTGLALDGRGNLYISDTLNNTIRKLVIATGQVTTVAGATRMAGNQDGTGKLALFNFPTGLAADGAGNLYVADASNFAIRRLALDTLEVTTLASAPTMIPNGLALDGAGNLYVADQNHVIRQIELATGVSTVLAGVESQSGTADGMGAAARFNAPHGIAFDGSGSLYVADSDNGLVRKIQLADGSVTTPIGLIGQRGVRLGALPAALNQPRALAFQPTIGMFLLDENSLLWVH